MVAAALPFRIPMVNKKAANPVGSAALVLRAAASLSDHLFISRAAGPS